MQHCFAEAGAPFSAHFIEGYFACSTIDWLCVPQRWVDSSTHCPLCGLSGACSNSVGGHLVKLATPAAIFNIVGTPLAAMLRDEGAAAVTVCHRISYSDHSECSHCVPPHQLQRESVSATMRGNVEVQHVCVCVSYSECDHCMPLHQRVSVPATMSESVELQTLDRPPSSTPLAIQQIEVPHLTNPTLTYPTLNKPNYLMFL
eukprot:1160698-Pelagomonas_calceolata.AAC.8